jgi:hypothetical protein
MIGSRETLSQPQSRRTASPPSRERVGAGAGGAGGGAALISIAQHLGPNTWPGLILLYCSPLIGILVGGGIEQISMWDQRRRANAALTNARKTIEQQLEGAVGADGSRGRRSAGGCSQVNQVVVEVAAPYIGRRGEFDDDTPAITRT